MKYIIVLIAILIMIASSGCLEGEIIYEEIVEEFQSIIELILGFDNQLTFNATVINIVDGDTIDVEKETGNIHRIRLLGVDTPERNELWRNEATQFTKSVLYNNDVIVVFDGQTREKCKFGRYLAYIYINDANFNAQLLKNGYAKIRDCDFKLKNDFLAYERIARDKEIGLWS